MTKNNVNPKLTKSPLSEVLVELRYTPPQEISLLIGKLSQQLNEYPVFENLMVPDFPISTPEFDKLIRYRFYNESKSKLYNLGKGVISVNSLTYGGFDEFLADVNTVLIKHRELTTVEKITRVGLRYINKIQVDRPIADILAVGFDLPKIISDIEKGFNFTSSGEIENGALTTRILTSTTNKSELIIDFDFYKNDFGEYDLDNINEWIDCGHDVIYNAFKSLLVPNYFKELE